jgi:probable F420-dependent oxidoreductase
VAFECGVILPNYGSGATPAGVARVAEAAERLGFHSVWTTEHLLVGPEAVDPYCTVLDSLTMLSWLAGLTERVALGTSIVILPLHHPIRLAKESATLQQLSGGRLNLGVGVGWHEDEFRFFGVPYAERSRRTDESIRILRALWRGEPSFAGEFWSFEGATARPLPEPAPEVWIGGRSLRRVRELGDVWHPTRISPDELRAVKERHPDCGSFRARPPSMSRGCAPRAPTASSCRSASIRTRSSRPWSASSPSARHPRRLRRRVRVGGRHALLDTGGAADRLGVRTCLGDADRTPARTAVRAPRGDPGRAGRRIGRLAGPGRRGKRRRPAVGIYGASDWKGLDRGAARLRGGRGRRGHRGGVRRAALRGTAGRAGVRGRRDRARGRRTRSGLLQRSRRPRSSP